MTELADELLTRGLNGVYSMSYEALRASTQMWEYLGLADGVVYGPYTAQQLAGWKAQGYFAGPTAVQVRPVGDNHTADGVTPSNNNSSAVKTCVPASSIYDDDDIYDTGDSKAKAPASVVAAAVVQWQSSDDVDFGEYVNLDQAQLQMQEQLKQQQRKKQQLQQRQQRADGGTTAAVESKSDNSDDDGEVLRARSARNANEKSVTFQMRGNAGGNDNNKDDDDNEDDDEEEDMGYRSKSKARNSKGLQEQQDSDEED